MKNGKDPNGHQRYLCRSCRKSRVDSPGYKRGCRPILGDRPMTAAERKQRSRDKKKKEEN